MTLLDKLKHHATGAIERGESQAVAGVPTKRKQFDPFPKVSCKFGAPMGRHGDNPANLQGVKRLHARRQGGGQGYDKGGAYWGTPSNVWGVWSNFKEGTCVVYIRANSRLEAIEKVIDTFGRAS